MRLDRLTPAHVRRAIQIYLERAWPEGKGEPKLNPAELEAHPTLSALFECFDRPQGDDTPALKRYTLRLGNWRYPFMKFVVQEYLVHEEYFFSVDTHDDIKITPDMPDWEGWQEVRDFNRNLKLAVEEAWSQAQLPTNADLMQLMEGLAHLEREESKRARLLVVDDERHVALGLQAVLQARGYDVEVAFDGLQVVERLKCDPLPDLVLLDYAMPELDGEDVLKLVRADPRCRDVHVLLATATDIDLTAISRTSGFLRKPYPRELLFAMIGRLLRGGPAPTGTLP